MAPVGDGSTVGDGLVDEAGAQPSDGFLDAGGLRLHYLTWGPGHSTSLVFLHGGGLTAHTWTGVAGRLSASYTCVALDLRGHGDSEWSTDGRYPLADHVGDVVALIDAVRPARFVLVGMSLAAGVALGYASRRPAGLAGLVLVDGGPRLERPASTRVRDFLTGPEEAESIDELVDRALAFNPRRNRDDLLRSVVRNVRQTERGTWVWKYDRRAFERPSMSPGAGDADWAARQATLRDWAATVACPTLIVRGAESDLFFHSDAIALVGAMQAARWVSIEGAGHTVQGDRPAELAEAISDFVSG